MYLPKQWADDPARCKKAGIPEGTALVTKPQLAKGMLRRAFAAGVPAAWVTGDEVYGSDGGLRRWLEDEKHPYVLAVRANQYVWKGFQQFKVAALAKSLPKRAWHKVTIAAGSKGPRRYAWAWLPINHALGPKWRRWLLVRKSLDDSEELAYYLAAGPARTTLTRLAVTAGARWAIEGTFEAAKQEVGLADYEVRSWTGWHRHVTLALLAHAVLAAVRKLAEGPPKKKLADEPELIGLTVPEARRLLVRLLWSRLPEVGEVLDWSEWRRAHQAFARRCHYKKRGADPPG